ncbi:hypothetical protein DFP73DRAFT_498600 [Morchella snyderi]|nr:hypothetical protein DFP73DRAFT_498600 [Morchella snyderi]
MGDPSASVSPQLLHHLHAVCVMKYPIYQSIQPDHLIDLLLKAPAVVQQYPFMWTMIEPPAAGTLMLSWHPPQMGTGCASDGYVWADPENVHTVDVKGYQVEIYYHKAGFNPNPNLQAVQSHALFSRRCYRLKPSAPTSPPETHNFWLLHYLNAERQNQVPIASIPITQGARQSFSARSYIAQLFAAGQLPRKEFYLGDPNTWPMITLPNQQQQQQQQQQQPLPPQTPQNPRGYYTPTPTRPAPPKPAPPSAKRLKPTPPTHPQAAVDPGMTIDEEEDTSRGDMLDHLSPREIATTRYIQHHEWMEEVLGSVYSISRIKPVDLGLGLRGELESVTMGLLDPPVYPPTPATNKDAPEGKDQQAILEQFRPRVEQKIADIEAEIKHMEALHAARLNKISKSGIAKEAELKLRSTMAPPTPDPAAAEEGAVDPVLAQLQSADVDTRAMDAIVAEVEAAIGKKVIEKQMLVKWELPVDEIIKMGGVVAEGNGGLDTDMGGGSGGGNGQDGEGEGEQAGSSGAAGTDSDEFAGLDLDVGSLGTGDETAFHGEGEGVGAASDALAGVDTIMDDFMNVDSKPDTPAGEKKDGSVDGNPDDGFTFDADDDKDGISGGMDLLGGPDDTDL